MPPLDAPEVASQKPSQQSKKSKKSQKPAWATTEKQQEEDKEKEIDELLEFAYELDYDKFMEDQEIRLAFEVIKDRVEEIKKDHDWKEQLAAEWNEETEKEKLQAQEVEQQPAEKASVYSYSKLIVFVCGFIFLTHYVSFRIHQVQDIIHVAGEGGEEV